VGRTGSRVSVGIPGSGFFYFFTLGGGGRKRSKKSKAARSGPPKLDLGFFERIFAPESEIGFVEGCKALLVDRPRKALAAFRNSENIADGCALAGLCAFRLGDYRGAERYLNKALQDEARLGSLLGKYRLELDLSLPITREIHAVVRPDERGIRLTLAEIYQKEGKVAEAIECLKVLQMGAPEDVVLRLSLAELLSESGRYEEVIENLAGLENLDFVHTGCLLYLGRAFRQKGLGDAAIAVFNQALRRKKGRPRELMQQLRFERGLTYMQLGRRAPARKDLEKLYAENPRFKGLGRYLAFLRG